MRQLLYQEAPIAVRAGLATNSKKEPLQQILMRQAFLSPMPRPRR